MAALAFSETMRGTYAHDNEPLRWLPLEFSIRVESQSLSPTGVRARVCGTLRAQDLASDVPVTGTLEVSLPARTISYDLQFRDDQNRELRLVGTKNVRLLELRRTMTELPATMTSQDGEIRATCNLAFDLRADLGPFLRSFGFASATTAP